MPEPRREDLQCHEGISWPAQCMLFVLPELSWSLSHMWDVTLSHLGSCNGAIGWGGRPCLGCFVLGGVGCVRERCHLWGSRVPAIEPYAVLHIGGACG